MENKICTTVEQSKKLIELGIDVDTSDMVYLKSYFEEEGEYNLLTGSYHEGYMEKDDGSLIPIFDEHIPAWSLSALLDLMPNVKGHYPELCRGKLTGQYYMWIENTFDTQMFDNPIDAAIEMIVWLKENNKI